MTGVQRIPRSLIFSSRVSRNNAFLDNSVESVGAVRVDGFNAGTDATVDRSMCVVCAPSAPHDGRAADTAVVDFFVEGLSKQCF